MNAFQKALKPEIQAIVIKAGVYAIMSKGIAIHDDREIIFEGTFNECLDEMRKLNKQKAKENG